MSSQDKLAILKDTEKIGGWCPPQQGTTPRATPRTTLRATPRTTPRASPRTTLRATPRTTPRASPRTTPRATPPKQDSQESSGLPSLATYWTRWYILLVFSALACHQGAVWNTFGPIDEMANAAYGWQDSTVAMFANWGTITFCIFVVPLTWLIEARGLRVTVVLISGLVAAGTVLRCCTVLIDNDTVFLISCHICAILNGIAGVTIMAAPPLISSLWFPISERTSSTGINLAGNALGNGVAMTLGPALVNAGNSNNTKTPGRNPSIELWPNLQMEVQEMGTNNYTNTTLHQIKQEINTYMQLDAGVAVAIFAVILVYFPAKPPLPPSPTSAIQRTHFRQGIKALLTNKDVLLVAICASISQGVSGCWMGVMVINLKDLNIPEADIGFIGLASVLGQCGFAMLVGYCTDRLKRHMKTTLLVLLSASTCFFTWFMLMCIGVLHYDLVHLYIAIVSAASINFGCNPLFFEMSSEIAYPVNESLVGAFLTGMANVVGIVFLFIFFIPNIGSHWMNYALVGSNVAVIPPLLMIKEQYYRSQIDELVTDHSNE